MTLKPASISVVMPSYNERDNIVEAIDRIDAALGAALLGIVIVDDNSPDRTWELIEQHGNPKARVIRRLNKRGLASALADGTQAAKGEIVVWLDCDLGIPPEDILKLVEKMDEYDIAVGSRYVPGGMDTRPKLRAMMSTLLNTITRFILGVDFWDWTSGFAAARKTALEKAPLTPDGFGEYFNQWVYDSAKANLKIIEVPYRYGLRKAGVSKTDGDLRVFFKLGISYAWKVLSVRIHGVTKRP